MAHLSGGCQGWLVEYPLLFFFDPSRCSGFSCIAELGRDVDSKEGESISLSCRSCMRYVEITPRLLGKSLLQAGFFFVLHLIRKSIVYRLLQIFAW